MTDDRRTSVDFEPVAIRPPGRRRRPDPVLIGAVAVVVALVVAVAKPWDGDPTVAIASPQPRATAAASVPVPSIRPLDLTDPADAATLVSVLAPHPTWGVRVIAQEPGAASAGGLVEHWLQAVPTPDGRISPLVMSSVTGIAALGVTSPPVVTPIDVRAWGRGLDGQWHWLDVGTVATDDPAADLLLPPPIVDGVALPAWPVGRYRLDLLMGQVAYQLDLTIDPEVPAPEAPVSQWTPPATTGPLGGLGDVPVGAFAVGDGFVASLGGQPGPRLSDAGAWLATDQVATASLPSTTGLGVLLPVGARDVRGVIRRLAPEPFFLTPDGQIAIRANAADEPSPYVQFDAPEGTRFEPGVYALDTQWTDATGPQAQTWTVTLRPAPALRDPTLLQATRRFLPAAGTDSLILRAAGSRGPDAATGPVQTLPLADAMGCDDVRLDASPPVLGLGHATDIYPRSIVATLIRTNEADVDIPLRIAPAVVPGLTLIAPEREAAFAPGRYQFTLTEAARPVAFTLCLGDPPFLS